MKKQRFLFWIILLVLAACELLLSWRVDGFSDFYVEKVFPIFLNTYGRISALFPFSIGEMLIYGAVGYTVFTVVIWMCRFVHFVDGKDRLKRFSRINSKIFFKLLIFICLVQVQNCFVLYHTSVLYEGTEAEDYDGTKEELVALRERLCVRANELSVTFERDENGEIIYDGDMKETAKAAMKNLGDEAKSRLGSVSEEMLDRKLSLLSGFYSSPKAFYKSDFFSQQYIKGYYFPFTLEANYNDLMYIANLPDTMCHELCHLKGFIFEDEASFIAYLACINSQDEFFEYSGILNALSYVDSEIDKEASKDESLVGLLTTENDYVRFDKTFLTSEAWAKVESDALIDTKKVSKASDTFLDTNLTLNGVSDGIVSYSRMVKLLLKYYR